MTTLPQTTAIRLPRAAGPTPLAPAGGAMPSLAGGASAGSISGGDVWRIMRNNIWLILFMLVFAAGAGYGVNEFLKQKYPHYTSVGYIQVKTTTDDPMNPRKNEQVDTGNLTVEQKTQAAYLMSETLLTEVLKNENGEIRKTEWFKKFNNNIAAAKEDFIDNYSVRPLPETRLVRMEFTNAFPKDCQVIVKEMGTKHIADEAERIFLDGQQKSVALTAMHNRYRMELQESEARLTHMRANVQISGGGVLSRVNLKENELDQLRKERSTIDLNLKSAQGQLDALDKSLTAGIDPYIVEQQVDANQQLQYFKNQVIGLQQQYDAVRENRGDAHPDVKKALNGFERAKQQATEYESETRAKVRANVRDQLSQNTAGQSAMLATINTNIESVTADLGDVTNQMVTYYAAEAAQKAIVEKNKQVEEQLEFLQNEQQQKLAGKVQWAVQPEVPTTRSFPQLKYTMPIAIVIGLALALSIAFLREMTDTTIRSPRDIQRIGQMTLLGMIGDETQDPQAAGARLPLVIFDAPHSMTAEQLRQVRTRLQHAASLDTTRSILVTSPSPGDGKTTVACNIAAGLALNGRRILLVDGNFRRPEIHKVFALANEQGFSDVLNGAVTFDEVVQETQVPNLSVMTSGPKPINATEMFESQLLIDFIDRALEEFDHVIFDSGPMMVVSESQAMAPKVDGVITVVRARTNSRGLLQRMRDALRAVKAEHLGVVLNGVRAQGGGYYGSTIKTYYDYQNV